jgi:hypothetical protein
MENRMRKLLLTVGLLGSAVCGAQGADLLTKAPAPAVAPSCFASVASYFQASAQECPLTWNGITLYGTIDTGGGYQTHGVPFNGAYPNGVEHLISKNSNACADVGPVLHRAWRAGISTSKTSAPLSVFASSFRGRR